MAYMDAMTIAAGLIEATARADEQTGRDRRHTAYIHVGNA